MCTTGGTSEVAVNKHSLLDSAYLYYLCMPYPAASLLYFSRDFAKSGFAFHFEWQLQTVISLRVLYGLSWNLNWGFSNMYSRCLQQKFAQNISASISCFWQCGGKFLSQTALLATEGNRIAWNFACTCLYTSSRCSRFIVEFRKHPSEWQLLHWARP